MRKQGGSKDTDSTPANLCAGESKFPLNLVVLEFSSECAMIKVVLHTDLCLRNALICNT